MDPRRRRCSRQPVAPPLARGWTRSDVYAAISIGSPARAGMDPTPRSPRSIPLRLPRSRGDGPWISRSSRRPKPAPPLARGWTLSSSAAFRRSWRLPRSRGDGPATRSPSSRVRVAPPLARGWTPDRPAPGKQPWLPRSRGDGPQAASQCRRLRWAPPLARGWTLPPEPAQWPNEAPPLARGWTLEMINLLLSLNRLPRSRGDRP